METTTIQVVLTWFGLFHQSWHCSCMSFLYLCTLPLPLAHFYFILPTESYNIQQKKKKQRQKKWFQWLKSPTVNISIYTKHSSYCCWWWWWRCCCYSFNRHCCCQQARAITIVECISRRQYCSQPESIYRSFSVVVVVVAVYTRSRCVFKRFYVILFFCVVQFFANFLYIFCCSLSSAVENCSVRVFFQSILRWSQTWTTK